MTEAKVFDPPSEPDLLQEVLTRINAIQPLAAGVVERVELEIRQEYGGRRVILPKRRKHLSQEQRYQAYVDGLSGMPTAQVVEKHGIDRATLYRLMKRGA